ncbi:MAG TPA: hypothetical protein VF630_16940 [Hymenobacter sp.]
MKEIRQWLEGEERDYAAGVALYAAHGRSQVVRRVLAFGETAFNRDKLVQELQKLANVIVNDGVNVRVTAPADTADRAAIVDKAPAVDPQRRDWFAERNHLHAQLGLVATDRERLEMSLRILELGDLIRQSYDQAAPGAAPAGPATPGLESLTDAGEMRRLLANLRPQRTKLKKRPDRATDLLQVEADIHLLEEKLKP